jgi:UDP-glucose 4-epimerase
MTRFTAQAFVDKRVLITGGLGFLGSNLAIRLVELGAQVTVMDCMLPGHGANLFNIAPIKDRVKVTYTDIRDANLMGYLVKDQDYLFHLAGQVDHIISLTDPYPDIDINIRGTATVMEACRHHNPTVKVIYTGTRGEYGAQPRLPVDEDAPTTPKVLLDISNLTAERIVLMYHQVHHIPSIVLRLTNIYGARAQMKHPRYGVVNWFVRLAIDDEEIKVFGDGGILRDFLYVDDCIDAMLMASLCDAAYGEVFNVATGTPCSFLQLVETLIEVAGSGRWTFAPFSPERAAQEPGDFYANIDKIKRVVGWQPRTSLRDGLAQTVAYYRAHKSEYW